MAPIAWPIKKVMPAAKRPSVSWRLPERQTLTPVKIVITAPIANKCESAEADAQHNATPPAVSKNGRIGTMAPSAKSMNDAMAAS